MGDTPLDIYITAITAGVMRVGMVVMRIAGGVMRIARFVMRIAAGVMRAAPSPPQNSV